MKNLIKVYCTNYNHTFEWIIGYTESYIEAIKLQNEFIINSIGLEIYENSNLFVTMKEL